MRIALLIVRRMLDLALVLLVALVIAIVLVSNLGPRLGHQLIVIRGASMAPALPLGSAVDVVSVQPGDIQPGDVVTLKEPNGTLLTHRVTRVVSGPDGIWLETRGDANSSVDLMLQPASSIVGRVDLDAPCLGYVIFLLTIPFGILSVLSLGMTLLLGTWLLEDLEWAWADGQPSRLAGPASGLSRP
jgi:signal peptidase I